MDSTCSMIGCYNSSNSLVLQQFYSFPKNFDLCMLWVQNCGRAELFEDFAYGGAQPFINKVICSDHFNNSDFNDSNCLSKGLKQDAVPNLNYDESDLVVVKQEYDDLDDSFPDDSLADDSLADDSLADNALADDVLIESAHEPGKNGYIKCADKIDNLLKRESVEAETAKLYSTNLSNQFDESVERFFYDDLEQDKVLVEPYIPFLALSKEKVRFKEKDADSVEFQKSQKAFKTAWKRALESAEQREARNRANALRNAFRRANETEEQRKARNQANALRNASKRASESDDEKKDRLYKNAVRAALRRSMESEDEQKERRRKNALRAACRRSAESEEQRTERRLKDKIRSAERRKRETDLQCKIRRYNDAVRAAFRRNHENNNQRQQRRMYDVMRAARRRSSESPEQRMKRLQADRERAAKRRMIKKLAHNVANMQNAFFNPDLGSYFNHDNGSSNSSLKSERLEHAANGSVQENFSNDELSNQSSYTYSEVSEHNVDFVNNTQNNFNTISDSNNLTNFGGSIDVMNLPNLILHNSSVEVNSGATTEQQPVSTVATPEVVWCT